MANQTVRDQFTELFLDQLRDVYNAEEQILQSIPKILNQVSTPELAALLENHLKETKAQKEKLKQVFTELDESSEGKTCSAMQGLIKELNDLASANYSGIVKDAALIAGLQKIEHYEIATFGTLRTFAAHLEEENIRKQLQEILNQDGSTNERLTNIAEGGIFTDGVNTEAARKS